MSAQNTGKISPLVIMGILFFVFGFVTWLNGTLIPFLKLACQLESDVQAFFVTFAFYMAYFFLALPSSFILRKTGYKNGMAMGLVVMAIGSVVFIPAAYSRSFPLFLIGLFIQGAGLALLQTASNPYISIIGPMESAAKRISIMGICNKVAGIVSPLVLGALILKNAGEIETQIIAEQNQGLKAVLLQQLADRVVMPYMVIAVVLLLLAIMINRSSLPEVETAQTTEGGSDNKQNVFQFPHLMLGVLCLFVYLGVEVLAGDAIGIYGAELGLPLDETKYFTSFTLFAMLAGYVIGIFTIPRWLSQQVALKVSAILGVVFTVCIFFSSGYTAIVFIALLGLANALMWPVIFPLAIDGLGRFTQTGSALLIMGISGGALIPLFYTSLKDSGLMSNNGAFLLCCLPAYLYILFYAQKGHKVGKGKKAVPAKRVPAAVTG